MEQIAGILEGTDIWGYLDNLFLFFSKIISFRRR